MNMTSMSASNQRVVVIGGGAAGMMAAGCAAEHGAAVTLLEPNDRLGKKLLITGKGRCNVTNDCPWEDVLKNTPTNPRFLYSALSRFSPADAKAFFEAHGCALKTERGNRVFPVSDRSSDVQAALERYLRQTGVQVRHTRAMEIAVQDGAVCGVKTANGPIPADAVILATGGCSYPLTGSTGDGYRMAAALGHTIVEPVGSLVPLVERGHDCAAMQGLALKNVTLRLKNAKGKVVFEEFGELLFTHFGLSGPIVLSASAHMDRKGEAFTVDLDLKPALHEDGRAGRHPRHLLVQPVHDAGAVFQNAARSGVRRRARRAPARDAHAVARPSGLPPRRSGPLPQGLYPPDLLIIAPVSPKPPFSGGLFCCTGVDGRCSQMIFGEFTNISILAY